MTTASIYRLGGCFCYECVYQNSVGWCSKWDNMTDEDGFCHRGEIKEMCENDLGLREEKERQDEQYDRQ